MKRAPKQRKKEAPLVEKEVSSKQLNRRNFIAFGAFAGLSAVGYGGWRWLVKAPMEKAAVTAGRSVPLRRALNQNELFMRRLFSRNHLVKTYPVNMAAKNARENSFVGLEGKFDPNDWKLNVKKQSGETLTLTINDIIKMPKTDIVFDFKCVEGWDQIQHWGGVKFVDFLEHLGLHSEAEAEYVGMMTPDKQYYVGIDMPSALHPQTMLAYELNGKPMSLNHGFPLRLIIPVKYGIKNLKRIGDITFSNRRPPDYWAEQGYDYYSGL
ncbi:MAG: molybdopterin-dependent oxidoreductase [Bacteroidota bacterium]